MTLKSGVYKISDRDARKLLAVVKSKDAAAQRVAAFRRKTAGLSMAEARLRKFHFNNQITPGRSSKGKPIVFKPFKQPVVPTSELLSTPAPRYVGQAWGFRPPDKLDAPPSWWQGVRCGECAGGANGNVVRQFWRDYAHNDDTFMVRLVAEDIIVGTQIRRSERLEAKIKNDILGPLQSERLESALRRARVDLLTSCPHLAND